MSRNECLFLVDAGEGRMGLADKVRRHTIELDPIPELVPGTVRHYFRLLVNGQVVEGMKIDQVGKVGQTVVKNINDHNRVHANLVATGKMVGETPTITQQRELDNNKRSLVATDRKLPIRLRSGWFGDRHSE